MAGLESVWLEHPDLNPDPDTVFQSALNGAFENLQFGEDKSNAAALQKHLEKFGPYQFEAKNYIEEFLAWTPWAGSEEAPGQMEVVEAYELALRQQHERDEFEAGKISAAELKFWKPGQVIQNWIRIEAGHTVGKTKLSSGLVNHFFDCFAPSIIYTFAPTWTQIHDLLWKEIKSDRKNAVSSGKKLPGRILELELKISDNHFATGRATTDAGGKGTERVQGQHGKYLMFVLDEAEGIPKFVYNAIKSMASGGICIVLMLANPRTRTSDFHKAKSLSYVRSFRISCLHHPNVLQGREVVPGAVRRQYVEGMIEGDGDGGGNCEIVEAHEPDEHTFELPFPVTLSGVEYPPGTVFKPNAEFLFRVLGIAPANLADNTFVPVGRFEAAKKRKREEVQARAKRRIRIGVDVSRYGKDFGTVYVHHDGCVWREKQLWKQDTNEYAGAIKTVALRLWDEAPEDEKPVTLHVRVDGGGGFGGNVVDALKNDPVLKEKFPGEDNFLLLEVHFNATPHDKTAYYDLATEMYAEAAKVLRNLALLRAPGALEADLCERTFEWASRDGVAVKKLTAKEKFKKLFKRSPDDGDGFVLAVSPDHIFKRKPSMDGW